MKQPYFLNVIRHVRQQEEVVLYQKVLHYSEADAAETIAFLEGEYQRESLGYPGKAPDFDGTAALWAANTFYVAAQLLLYREHDSEALPQLFPAADFPITASAILSADLCLRFVPDIVVQLDAIDVEDPLVAALETLLRTFHYSAIGHQFHDKNATMSALPNNDCLLQLYADRVVKCKNRSLASQEPIRSLILSNLGAYAPEFWNDLTMSTD